MVLFWRLSHGGTLATKNTQPNECFIVQIHDKIKHENNTQSVYRFESAKASKEIEWCDAQRSPQQQHLAAPAAVAPHRAEQDLPPSYDALVLRRPTVEFQKE